MKICTKCKIQKPYSDFNKKTKARDGYSFTCRACSKSYLKIHYEKNSNYYITKAKERTNKKKAELSLWKANYLKTHPCVDCGEKDQVVLDFDHRERETKIDAPGRIRSNCNLKSYIAEIEKCDVRCCNCHRRRTAKQFNWKKYN